ncbi:MAG: nucleotidyltransferase domain-containing protein [Candidatus Bathyarchaeia archaeon]
MERLPEDFRNVLEKLLIDLKARESIVGIGLFGSWSRGDASLTSDVDLLVIEGRDFDYEYTERALIDNVFFDLNCVPLKWIVRQIPPEIDQKIFESQILLDRSGKFTIAKELMSKNYWTLERAEMRVGNYIVQADTYLSRIVSALNREDFQSANLSAATRTCPRMRVLLEVVRKPYSNSRFLRMLESAAIRLSLNELYDEYLDLVGFTKVNKQEAESILASVTEAWQKVIGFVQENSSKIEKAHVRVKNDINYYCKESFLKGMEIRAQTLINESLYEEAAHYLFRGTMSMLENYVWFISTLEGTRFDFTNLFQRLKNSSLSPSDIYQKIVEAFNLENISQSEAEESQKKARETVSKIRNKRREFAETFDV